MTWSFAAYSFLLNIRTVGVLVCEQPTCMTPFSTYDICASVFTSRVASARLRDNRACPHHPRPSFMDVIYHQTPYSSGSQYFFMSATPKLTEISVYCIYIVISIVAGCFISQQFMYSRLALTIHKSKSCNWALNYIITSILLQRMIM